MNAHTPIRFAPVTLTQETVMSAIPELWAIFRRRFRLFISVLMIVLALVAVVTLRLTPTYDATSKVVLNARQTQALDVSAFISGMSPDTAVVTTEVELIGGRSMATRVAEELNLYTVPEFNPLAEGKVDLLERLIPPQFAGEPPSENVIKARTIDRLMDRVTVERAGVTYAIDVTATSEDPELAAAIADTYARQYLIDQLDQKFETYELMTDYLDTAVARTRGELRAAEIAVEQYRNETGLLSAEGSLLSEQQVSDLQAQLIIQEASLAERQAKYSAVNRRLSLGAGADAISDVLSSQTIATLRAKQADLARRRADLETRYGPKHPLVENIASESADLTAQINGEVGRIVAGLKNEVDVARERVLSLRRSIEELRDGLTADNQALVRLRELEREAEVSRRNYEQLLQRSQQAQLFEDLAEADARIADPASVPADPSFPNKKLNAALGLLLGTAMGGLAIALIEAFDSGIRTAEDVEKQLGAPLVALVPMLSQDKLQGDIATPQDYLVEKPLSAFAESYRTLRGVVMRSLPEGAKGRVVAFTSAVSGEGKTSSALCLGRISALAGDRTVVVDCDLRRRVLSAYIERDDTTAEAANTGLLPLVRGDATLDQSLVRDPRTDLSILPAALDRTGTGDPFGAQGFARVLASLRERFDVIILDTPPLTAVADARSVVEAADLVIQCVRWKETPVAVARSARKILADLDTPLGGALLTQVDMRRQAGYGYEGSYKYYAQHGTYYHD